MGWSRSDEEFRAIDSVIRRDGPVHLIHQMDDVAHAVEFGGRSFHDAMSELASKALAERFGGQMLPKNETNLVHFMRITPELRAAAMKGFPMFAAGGAVKPRLTPVDHDPFSGHNAAMRAVRRARDSGQRRQFNRD